MGTLNRFAGCLLGAAIGDALGRQTHGVDRPEAVPLVNDATLEWTDQTQHLLLTARGLLEALRWPYDRRVVGRAVAGELVDWYHDPTTVARRPGQSSLAAAVRLLEGADWEASGNPATDGADPLLRAIAVGLAYPPDKVAEPAALVAGMTHAHPTALQGATLIAWLVSALARGAPLAPETFRGAIAFTLDAQPEGDAVRSVRVALDLADHTRPGALAEIDPRSLPDGDCGHRAASAAGLAALLSLLHASPRDDSAFERALEAAARLPGAGEVVAALTGALLGAGYGLMVVPAPLVESLERRDDLLALARALHQRAQGLPLGLVGLEAPTDTLNPWVASTPEGAQPRWAAPSRVDGTDLEWSLTQVDAPPDAEGEEPPSSDEDEDEDSRRIEWITVAGEPREVMEDLDADLTQTIRRRW